MKYEVIMMNVQDLKTTTYQRQNIKYEKVKQISDEYDEIIFDPIKVAQRKDGFYYVIDGQHRLLAFKRRGEKQIPCRIVVATGKEHEADIFRKLNGKYASQKITQYDDYVAGLESADALILEMHSIITKYGFTVNYKNSDNNISAISALKWVFKKYRAPLLDAEMDIIRHGCYGNKAALQGNFLKGMACFLYAHSNNSSFNRETFIAKLQSIPTEEIVKQLNCHSSISFDLLATDIFTNIYNRNQRKYKI